MLKLWSHQSVLRPQAPVILVKKRELCTRAARERVIRKGPNLAGPLLRTVQKRCARCEHL